MESPRGASRSKPSETRVILWIRHAIHNIELPTINITPINPVIAVLGKPAPLLAYVVALDHLPIQYIVSVWGMNTTRGAL